MGDAARIKILTLNAGGAHVIFARIDHRQDNEFFVLCQADCAEKAGKQHQ